MEIKVVQDAKSIEADILVVSIFEGEKANLVKLIFFLPTEKKFTEKF